MVLRGVEISTDRGHLLAFGVEDDGWNVWSRNNYLPLEGVIARIAALGGVSVPAHPFREIGLASLLDGLLDLAGIAGVERELLWSARNMGANEREVVWDVVVPAASPQIMTGLQVALPIALIVAIVTEMLMGGYGVGSAMVGAWRFADSPGVFAGIVEMAIVGFAMVRGMALLRRRMLLWHQEAMEPATV